MNIQFYELISTINNSFFSKHFPTFLYLNIYSVLQTFHYPYKILLSHPGEIIQAHLYFQVGINTGTPI